MKKIVIFGAGNYGYQALLYYGQQNVAFFVDNAPDKQGKTVGEKPVLSFEEYLEKKENYKIVIACRKYEKIADQLQKSGVCDYSIFYKIVEECPLSVCIQKEADDKGQFAVSKVLEERYRTVGQINRIFFVGDNTDTPNLGCRATSKALYDLINTTVCIADVMRRSEIISCFSDTVFDGDDIWDFYAVVRQSDKMWPELKIRIENTDAVVMNGEGSFIFQVPPRYDTYVYLCIMLLCIELKKPFYLLNAMFSYGTGFEKNEKLLEQAVRIFEHASLITARDPFSVQILQRADKRNALSLKYVPDALFNWYDIFEQNRQLFYDLMINYKYCMAFDNEEPVAGVPIDLSKDYVLVSGNSYVAAYPENGIKIFNNLVDQLRLVLELQGIELYIMECCGGEKFLRQVSKTTGIPVIKVHNNIYLMATILQHARCYISGRYHPSILASLGGTPCVFMGSNSHKTESLQEVLQYKELRTFPAMPAEQDIKEMVEYTIKILSADGLRNTIKEKCLENQTLAGEIPFLCGFGKEIKKSDID